MNPWRESSPSRRAPPRIRGEATSDPAQHAAHLSHELSGLIEHMEADVTRVNEPRLKMLLSASAGMLRGLNSAFIHYRPEHPPAAGSPAPGGPAPA
ncbi:MAG TPA: hypothetical protein VL200_07105 [Lacunisphaera sp.]|jgi:hypothetical protein|nr:hypothetical protein [Lacunisphaera sp.]